MKSKPEFAVQFAAIVAAILIVGCTTTQDAEYGQRHSDNSTAQPMGMMGSGPGRQRGMTDMADMDMKSMCEMHSKMMSGKTPEEQKAMMDQRIKSMSPEMMKRHMAMMQECK